MQFNLSHSNAIALIAVMRHKEMGVDIEWVKQDSPLNAGRAKRLS
jgi:phosphopantetheinyl transferase